jgi:hypothetical protein
MFGYDNLYLLTHPWEFARCLGWETKYAWQRAMRGWDDTVAWDIGLWLCMFMPIWIRRLKEQKHGVPYRLFPDQTRDPTKEELEKAEKKFNQILDDIAAGFEAGYKIMDLGFPEEEYDELQAQFDHGMELFCEFFFDLWD